MSRTKSTGFVSRVLIAAAAAAVGGCSSSSTTTPNDAGTATHRPVVEAATTAPDSSTNDSGPGAATATFDGTSGKMCTSDADCNNGAGVNVCSNFYSGKLETLDGVSSPQFWPTPLCMVPLPTVAGVGNCDPGDPDVGLQFCDSADPTDPASPGICIPLTSPQMAGPTNGFCLPHCTFTFDGTRQMGCPGKDTCNQLNYLLDTTMNNAVTGHGFCQGTCQADTDCSALGTGWGCQTDEGVCTMGKKARTKTIGEACTNSGNGATPLATSDTATGACNCPFSGTDTTAFYCTQTCVIGGTACPAGYTCDPLVPGELPFFNPDGGSDLVIPGPTVQNPGMAGYCLATCNPDGGAAPGADGGCPGTSNTPPLSNCTAPTDFDGGGTAAGPDCLPPP
jgi:hypothetical protein